MKKLKKFLFAAFTVAILSCLFCQPAFAAISESDVQTQVDAVGKEAVSGNVFIWFLCAIGFLKVGQKIDSFLSSLGVNVGHTGGSMLAEAMIAARGIGGIKNFSSHHFGGGRNSSSTNVNANGSKGSGGFGAGFASGGLAGVVSRKVTNSAIKTATTTPGSKPSGLGSLLQEIWRHAPHPAAGDFLPEWKPCHTNGDMGKRRPGTLGDSHRQPARPTAKRPCLYRHQCRFGISHLAHPTWSGYPHRPHHAERVLHLSRISFSCQPAAGTGSGRVCRLPEKL